MVVASVNHVNSFAALGGLWLTPILEWGFSPMNWQRSNDVCQVNNAKNKSFSKLKLFVAYSLWSAYLEDRMCFLYVDNEGTKFSLMKGMSENSTVDDRWLRILLRLKHMCVRCVGFSRVSSFSNNIADAPSRGDCEVLEECLLLQDVSEEAQKTLERIWHLSQNQVGENGWAANPIWSKEVCDSCRNGDWQITSVDDMYDDWLFGSVNCASIQVTAAFLDPGTGGWAHNLCHRSFCNPPATPAPPWTTIFSLNYSDWTCSLPWLVRDRSFCAITHSQNGWAANPIWSKEACVSCMKSECE